MVKPNALLFGLVIPAGLVLAGCNAPKVQRQDEISRFRTEMQQRAVDIRPLASAPLSIEQCEQIALQNSLDLRVQQLALQLQDEQVRLAISDALPDANLTYSDTRRSNQNLVEQGGTQVEVSERRQKNLSIAAVMPALDFGITYYSYQNALDRRAQERLVLERAIQLLRRDVRIAYARHAGAVRQQALAEQALKAAQQVLRVARALEREQLTVRADTSLVEAALAQAEFELSLSRQNVEQTHLNLSQLMSLPPGTDFGVDPKLPALPAPPSIEQVAAFEDHALRVRPELFQQDLSQHIAANTVRREAAEFLPHLDLTGSFNWTGASSAVNQSFFTYGFNITHSLLDGGATIWRYNIAKQNVKIEKVRSLLAQLAVLYDIEVRALNVRQANETIAVARALEDSRRLALDRVISLYNEGLEDEAGAARALAELTTQATVLDRAQTDYQIAWYELETAALPELRPTVAAATGPTSQPATQTAPGNAAATEALPPTTQPNEQ